MASKTISKFNPSSCRSCGQKRIKTWCVNKKCEEYFGPLKACAVPKCDFPTPHLLCRTHFTKGEHCKHCARKVTEEGFCTKCDVLVECVISGCDGHAKWRGEHEFTIPLCKEHFGIRICLDHSMELVDGVCPDCGSDCVVADCDRPTMFGRPLCPAHYKAGKHCVCGEAFTTTDSESFCQRCDDNYKCATKACKARVSKHKYCSDCYTERNEYMVKRGIAVRA